MEVGDLTPSLRRRADGTGADKAEKAGSALAVCGPDAAFFRVNIRPAESPLVDWPLRRLKWPSQRPIT